MSKLSMKDTVWYSTTFANNTMFASVLLPNGESIKVAWSCENPEDFEDASYKLRDVLRVPDKYNIKRKSQTVTGDGTVYWWVD